MHRRLLDDPVRSGKLLATSTFLASLGAVTGVARPASASTASTPPVVLAGMEGFWETISNGLSELSLLMLDGVMWMLRNAPEPDLASEFFKGQFTLMSQVALWLSVPVVLVALITAVLKGGMKDVMVTTFVWLPVAILGGIAAMAVAELVQNIVNSLSDSLMDSMYADYRNFYDQLTATAVANPEQFDNVNDTKLINALVFFLLALASVILWAEMVFRTVGIYMAMFFIPLALAVYVWEPMRRWFTTLAEILAVLLISKFIVVATLSFGFAIMRSLGDTTNIANPDDIWSTVGLGLTGLITVLVATVASPLLMTKVVGSDGAGANFASLRGESPTNPDKANTRRKMKSMAGSALGLKKK